MLSSFEKNSVICVDDEYIAKGEPMVPNSCPLALATDGYFGSILDKEVSVFVEDNIIVDAYDPDVCFVISLEDEIREWVNDFDEGKDVSPININFKIVEKYLHENDFYIYGNASIV